MASARHLARTAAPLLLVLALGLAGCGSSTPGECSSVDQCPQPGGCRVATCLAGGCGVAPRPAGTVLGTGVAGDCQAQVCDGAGAVVAARDDADLPEDGNACTQDTCNAGAPSNAPLDAGQPCVQDLGAWCDGAGRCVQCLAPSDCPGVDGECATRTCLAGACGVVFAPQGTPLQDQVAGDCRVSACDGVGNQVTLPLDADLPDDGQACTQDLCAGGVASHQPVASGTGCTTAPGAGLCDGAGACVQCLVDANCAGVDGPCAHPTCTAGRCSTVLAPAGTFAGDFGAGDCSAVLCDGAGNAAGQAYPADVPVDGNPCTLDVCTGLTPSNPPAPAATSCAVGGGTVCDGAGACVECTSGAQCASLVCAGNACQAPSCGDTVRNGLETDLDCGGPCPACLDGRSCAIPADCLSLVCAQARCAAPACGDFVRNGAETDVDCGGACPACAPGLACRLDVDCRSGACVAGVCGAPRVTSVTPASGAADVVPGTAITLTFGAPLDLASITFQAAAGPCTGSVQLSADGFSTCLGIAARSAFFGSRDLLLKPALPLGGPATYQVRTLEGLLSSTVGAFQPFVHPGFTVAAGGGCGSALVVSQVYPGGGAAGASWAADYVELHNRAPSTISLAGLSLQVPWGNPWAVLPLSGSIPSGGYLLIQVGAAGATGAALPAPDLALAPPVSLAATGGIVTLLSTTTANSSGGCPPVGLLDAVGYGTSQGAPVSCKEGVAPATAPADAGAALVRAGAGCGDTDDNAFDLASQLAVPRTSSSPPLACGCAGSAVNESGATVEMDFCAVWSPVSLSLQAGTTSPPVSGRVFEAGVTEAPGPSVLVGQLGHGPAGSDPRYAVGWTWVAASFNVQVGNDDEYQASFSAPAPGSYAYAYRFSPDGQRWTYCDADGAGANGGLFFEPWMLPPLTVTP